MTVKELHLITIKTGAACNVYGDDFIKRYYILISFFTRYIYILKRKCQGQGQATSIALALLIRISAV